MTEETPPPTSMADEVTKRVLEALQPAFERIDQRFEQLTGEVRSKAKALGEDIDAINARMTADKASIDEQLGGLRQDLNRHSTSMKATLDSYTSRFRAISERLDGIDDRLDRIERHPVR